MYIGAPAPRRGPRSWGDHRSMATRSAVDLFPLAAELQRPTFQSHERALCINIFLPILRSQSPRRNMIQTHGIGFSAKVQLHQEGQSPYETEPIMPSRLLFILFVAAI